MPSPFDPPPSPSLSLKGWSWRVWLSRNKGPIKTLLSLLFAVLSSQIESVQVPEVKAALAVLVGLGSRLLLDVLDFWLSEVPAP